MKLINIERLIHSFKTCIACILAFALTRIMSFTADQWVVITVIVVMCAQIYVGSVIQKSYVRFLGTLLGCLLAAGVLIFYGTSMLTIACTIGAAGFIFSYIASGEDKYATAGTLGAVTTTIIMLGNHPDVSSAAMRFLEISLGITIATLVSQFILPIHARAHLRRAQSDTLLQLRQYYDTLMTTLAGKETQMDYYELDEDIVKSLLKQRQLANESAREPLGRTFDPDHFAKVLYFEREILRAITFMHAALMNITLSERAFVYSDSTNAFNQAILTIFDHLHKAVRTDNAATLTLTLPSLSLLQQAIQPGVRVLSRDDTINLDGFLFSASLLLHGLRKLATVFDVPLSS